eukprot:Hpha_TRINITY_DN7569_c0_g1::TRINITY_DN7569_c0_g1_i1::g.19088::m.19088
MRRGTPEDARSKAPPPPPAPPRKVPPPPPPPPPPSSKCPPARGTRLRVSKSWFEAALGFAEGGYYDTKRRLAESRDGERICGHLPGDWHWTSLAELRCRAVAACEAMQCGGEICFAIENMSGEARALHLETCSAGASFQVASQFNCLEFINPDRKPEHGVTGYESDRTQGPISAMCCAAALAYRNYLVPMPGGGTGQTVDSQLDGLAELKALLGEPDQYFEVRGGYTFSSSERLHALGKRLQEEGEEGQRRLRDALRLGVQYDCEVTAKGAPEAGSLVTQVFCAAISVPYSGLSASLWEPLGRLVLEAAYEATFYAAVIARARQKDLEGPARVFLTKLGAGVFGNPSPWVADGIERGWRRATDSLKQSGPGLDAKIVHHGDIDSDFGHLD